MRAPDPAPNLRRSTSSQRPAGRSPGNGARPRRPGPSRGTWVPVCLDGEMHGVLKVVTTASVTNDGCVEQLTALGHLMEMALANWAAHEELERQATSEERRRVARDLHDGLAHELAFIASKARRSGAPDEMKELSGAADRALDEARRAITVLSLSAPQSLVLRSPRPPRIWASGWVSPCSSTWTSRSTWTRTWRNSCCASCARASRMLRCTRMRNTSRVSLRQVNRRLSTRDRGRRARVRSEPCGPDPLRSRLDARTCGLARRIFLGGLLPWSRDAPRGDVPMNGPVNVLIADDHARTRALVTSGARTQRGVRGLRRGRELRRRRRGSQGHPARRVPARHQHAGQRHRSSPWHHHRAPRHGRRDAHGLASGRRPLRRAAGRRDRLPAQGHGRGLALDGTATGAQRRDAAAAQLGDPARRGVPRPRGVVASRCPGMSQRD